MSIYISSLLNKAETVLIPTTLTKSGVELLGYLTPLARLFSQQDFQLAEGKNLVDQLLTKFPNLEADFFEISEHLPIQMRYLAELAPQIDSLHKLYKCYSGDISLPDRVQYPQLLGYVQADFDSWFARKQEQLADRYVKEYKPIRIGADFCTNPLYQAYIGRVLEVLQGYELENEEIRNADFPIAEIVDKVKKIQQETRGDIDLTLNNLIVIKDEAFVTYTAAIKESLDNFVKANIKFKTELENKLEKECHGPYRNIKHFIEKITLISTDCANLLDSAPEPNVSDIRKDFINMGVDAEALQPCMEYILDTYISCYLKAIEIGKLDDFFEQHPSDDCFASAVDQLFWYGLEKFSIFRNEAIASLDKNTISRIDINTLKLDSAPFKAIHHLIKQSGALQFEHDPDFFIITLQTFAFGYYKDAPDLTYDKFPSLVTAFMNSCLRTGFSIKPTPKIDSTFFENRYQAHRHNPRAFEKIFIIQLLFSLQTNDKELFHNAFSRSHLRTLKSRRDTLPTNILDSILKKNPSGFIEVFVKANFLGGANSADKQQVIQFINTSFAPPIQNKTGLELIMDFNPVTFNKTLNDLLTIIYLLRYKHTDIRVINNRIQNFRFTFTLLLFIACFLTPVITAPAYFMTQRDDLDHVSQVAFSIMAAGMPLVILGVCGIPTIEALSRLASIPLERIAYRNFNQLLTALANFNPILDSLVGTLPNSMEKTSIQQWQTKINPEFRSIEAFKSESATKAYQYAHELLAICDAPTIKSYTQPHQELNIADNNDQAQLSCWESCFPPDPEKRPLLINAGN